MAPSLRVVPHFFLVLFVSLLQPYFCYSELDVEIPKKYRKNLDVSSQFCNTCSTIGAKLVELSNDSKYSSNEFELNLGFRLDSQGKKIRKKSSKRLMALLLELHDVCDNHVNADKFKIAKRKKSGFFYLIPSARVDEYDRNNTRDNNFETAKIMARVNAKYDNVTQAEDFDWDQKMARIPFEKPKDETEMNVTFEQKKDYFTKLMKFDYEREEAPEFWYNMKPKLIKKKLRKEYGKMIIDMCYLISEAMDEWLHGWESKARDSEEDVDIMEQINFDSFCIDEMHGLCSKEMLDRTEELTKQKSERKMVSKIPDKPRPMKKPAEPAEPVVADEDYEEESEVDTEDTEKNEGNESGEVANDDNGVESNGEQEKSEL